MRPRSATLTRTRSPSISATLALSLPWNANKPALETLPIEILLKIVQVAAAVPYRREGLVSQRLGSGGNDSDSGDEGVPVSASPVIDRRTLRALAHTSKALAVLAHAVLYRAVLLNQVKTIELFSRTTTANAHRDITLSPTIPIFRPSSFLGKSTTRLALDVPFSSELEHVTAAVGSARHRRLLNEQDRFMSAAGALLGLGSSAPSAPSPILVPLRTLVVDSDILIHHMRHLSPPTHYSVSPTPTELVLSTYLPAPSTVPSSLAPLATCLTHLVIALPPAKWCLPSATLATLGNAPMLTHLALVRRAHANEDNDAEFVQDVERVLVNRMGTLECVVLVVIPDSGFASWRTERVHNNHAKADPDAEMRSLEEYLCTSHIWSQLAVLSRLICPDITHRKDAPAVCVVAGSGNGWKRALMNSHASSMRFNSNIYNASEGRPQPLVGDLWSWARTFEVGRRAKDERLSQTAHTPT
ncbi:hypothetical protein M0805_004161 [Coniferiporia weirii]|nr:hypothetical protein M0805_004161 [Coniferiporia weirii]